VATGRGQCAAVAARTEGVIAPYDVQALAAHAHHHHRLLRPDDEDDDDDSDHDGSGDADAADVGRAYITIGCGEGETGLIYDPQGDLRLSAVGVGTLTAGLGPISQLVQTALTTPDYASSGIIRHSAVGNDITTAGLGDMQEGEYQPRSPAFPRQQDRVPLQDRGIPSRSSGQNSPNNTTIHQSERENSGAPGLEAEFTYDDEGRYDRVMNNGGDGDDEFGEREHDDRYSDPQPLHNGDVYDQTGLSCAAAMRYVVRDDTLMVETESERRYEARVKKRQMFTGNDSETRLVTTEQRPREDFSRKASRMDAAQRQIVHQQLSEFVFYSSFGDPVTAPGVNGFIPRTSDARRQPVADSLGYATCKSASNLDTLRAIRGVPADNTDSVASHGSAEMVSAIERHEEIKAAESKAAHDAKLQQIRNQCAYTTLGPSMGANKPPIVETTLLYDAGLSLHPENSQYPSSVEKVESDSPVRFEYSDSREDGQSRMRRPRTDARVIYPQGAPPPNSQQS
jgi:hypothetical protein